MVWLMGNIIGHINIFAVYCIWLVLRLVTVYRYTVFSRSYCYTVWSAIGSGLLSVRLSVRPSVCPSVCDAVHCGSQDRCREL